MKFCNNEEDEVRIKNVLRQILDDDNKRGTSVGNVGNGGTHMGLNIPKYRKDIIRQELLKEKT
jgi:hypothetical protein